jgi:hypothetical protein
MIFAATLFVALITVVLWKYWTNILNLMTDKTVEGVSKKLSNDEVQGEIIDLSTSLLDELLHFYTTDEQTQTEVIEIVRILLEDPEFVSMISKFLITLLDDPSFKIQVTNLAVWALEKSLEESYVQDQIASTIFYVFSTQEAHETLIWILKQTLANRYILHQLEQIAVWSLNSEMVMSMLNQKGLENAMYLLSKEMKVTCTQWLQDTLDDQNNHKKVGNFLFS